MDIFSYNILQIKCIPWNTGKVKQGMLAYVAETNRIYQFQQGIWIPW